MIKIDLDTTPKGKNGRLLNGSIEVVGEIEDIANEIYAILKDLEENVPEALFIALDKRMGEVADQLKE